MKKIILPTLLLTTVLMGCSKFGNRSGNVCIEPNKVISSVSENVTVSNCGDELPSDIIDLSIDWGDGTIDNGQAGEHAYDNPGTYEVRLLLNGDFAADVADVEESKVKHVITVQ